MRIYKKEFWTKGDIEVIIGYTTEVYKLFHISYPDLLKKAKRMCNKLVVGVNVRTISIYGFGKVEQELYAHLKKSKNIAMQVM